MSLRRVMMIGLTLFFAASGMRSSAQTVDVIVTASPGQVLSGQQVTINVDVEVTDPGYLTLTSTGVTATCTANGYSDFSISVSNWEAGGATSGYYQYSGEGSLTANGTLGSVTVDCNVSAIFTNGLTYTGDGSGTFSVVTCSGDSNYTETINESGSYEQAAWALTAINLTPAGLSPASETVYGTGISGTVPSQFLSDCDDGENGNIAEDDPTIQDAGQEFTGSTIIFNFVIWGYDYTADDCDACSMNPSGVENVRATSPIVNSASLTQSCSN